MSQRPKFKVHKYGMGRKTSLIAILQKLKPCLFDQYASFLGDKRQTMPLTLPADDDICPPNELPTEKSTRCQRESDDKLDRGKSIWQGRLKQGERKRLPTIEEVPKLPKEFDAHVNQLRKMRSVGSNTESPLTCPIKRFIISKLHELHLFEGIDGTVKFLIAYEHLKVWPQFALVLEPPRTARRVELDLVSDPMARHLLPLYFYRAGQFVISDSKAIAVLDKLEKEFYQRPPNDDCPARQSLAIVESITNTLTSFMAMFQPPWARDPNKFMKIVLTYFVLFCVIGFLFTVFP